MAIFLAFSLFLTEQSVPSFTETQLRDVGCVAVVSIISEEQRRGAPGADDYPDVREISRRWASIAIDRISRESGQSKEAIQTAIRGAVENEQAVAWDAADPKAYVDQRMATCLALMHTDLEGAHGLQ